MAIYIAGIKDYPKTAIIIDALGKKSAIKIAAKFLNISEDYFKNKNELVILKRLFTGHAVGKPRGIKIEDEFKKERES